jgi:hypothetical protein
VPSQAHAEGPYLPPSVSEAVLTGTPQRSTLAELGRAVAWRVVAGTAAGAVAGFLVGGIGGRLAMLLLRLTSPDAVMGLTTDDGFEIGAISASTFPFLAAMTMLGGINGALYAGLRGAIPARLRLPLWTVAWACIVGAGVVHDDGIDFVVLDPLWLAIALFVLLPGVAAAVVVVLAERWSALPPWGSRRRGALLVVAALASSFAAVVVTGVAVLMLAVLALLERPGLWASLVRRAALVFVPLALTAAAALGASDLAAESSRILD